jgi:hypothetical protein
VLPSLSGCLSDSECNSALGAEAVAERTYLCWCWRRPAHHHYNLVAVTPTHRPRAQYSQVRYTRLRVAVLGPQGDATVLLRGKGPSQNTAA